MFEYFFARHRNDYIRLAIHFRTTPTHVWKLAHGQIAKTRKETEILHELLEMGIVHRHQHSRNADDYDMSDEEKK